jgi:hypothetical protein
MKKNISISADKALIESFTDLAHEFWTNRTNLLNMMMTEIIRSRELNFKRNYLEVEYEPFSDEENKILMEKWWATVSKIFTTLDKQLWK